MATRQATTTTWPRTSSMLCLLFFITAATLNTPATVGQSSPPSTLVLYVRQNSTTDQDIVVSARPPGDSSPSAFGLIAVISNVVREGQTADSPAVGLLEGEVIIEKDLSRFFSGAYVLNTTAFTGSITVQGVLDAAGNGEVAITGGTSDFRYARGYVDLSFVSQDDPELFSRRNVLHIKYD